MSTLSPSTPSPDAPPPDGAAPVAPSRRVVSRRRLFASTAALTAAGGAVVLAPAAHAGPRDDRGGRGRGHDRARLPDPTFTDVSVHDPSVVVADGEFFVFGSHLAAARTPDLMHWEGVADLVTPENPLFEDVTIELAEAFEWANTTTLWAADVTRTDDGRYRMYYCACEGSSPRSAMGSAIADHVEGPYVDEGIFLRSGMWDQPSEDGEIYDARVHPNVIDPHLIEGADGRDHLLYGSYSGGIFLLETDPDTGRPLPGQGYGTHLCGGNHARIEAPYLLHLPETGYYYLLLTFGGLDANGGYNIRVGRSRDIEGPYLDPMGQDLREAKADPDLPLFDDASVEPYGAKLMGNHRITQADGTVGQGYVSPGHVSAWRDPEDGGAFLIFHTRFPDTGEFHQVRVHRLHTTRDGWIVVAPHRYGGEPPVGSRQARVRRDDLPGTWQLVDHGRAISPEIVASQTISLEKDGRISGAVSGRWRLEGRERVVLTIEGQRFDGAAAFGWHHELGAWTPTLSVLGDDGRALWATREV